MKDFIEKSKLFGLGLFDASKEGIEEFVEDMLERGKIQKEQAEDLKEELRMRREKEEEEMEGVFRENIREILIDELKTNQEVRDEIKKIIEE